MSNAAQRAYYESRFVARGGSEQAASTATNAWTRLRRLVQSYDQRLGINDTLIRLHKEWCGDLTGRRVLDLGCFSGNPLSVWLAENAGEYLGVDLSDSAVAELNDKLAHLPHAQAVAGDILDGDYGTFDVIYARSVLHHFQDPVILAAAITQLLNPGGVLVGMDPMQTEPVNRLARLMYRPVQTDRAWEWPLTRWFFTAFQVHFELDRVQGWRGFSKLGRRGWQLDQRLANRKGLALWLCWNVTYRMSRRRSPSQQ